MFKIYNTYTHNGRKKELVENLKKIYINPELPYMMLKY